MQHYEYRVVPAPRKGEKARGLKTTPERFAHALTQAMNDMAREGWEYLRADTLPCDERVGLTGRATTTQHVLVFRREQAAANPAGEFHHAPVAAAPAGAAAPRLGAAQVEEGKAPPVGPARDEAERG